MNCLWLINQLIELINGAFSYVECAFSFQIEWRSMWKPQIDGDFKIVLIDLSINCCIYQLNLPYYQLWIIGFEAVHIIRFVWLARHCFVCRWIDNFNIFIGRGKSITKSKNNNNQTGNFIRTATKICFCTFTKINENVMAKTTTVPNIIKVNQHFTISERLPRNIFYLTRKASKQISMTQKKIYGNKTKQSVRFDVLQLKPCVSCLPLKNCSLHVHIIVRIKFCSFGIRLVHSNI